MAWETIIPLAAFAGLATLWVLLVLRAGAGG